MFALKMIETLNLFGSIAFDLMIGVYALIIIMYLTLPFLSTSFSLNNHGGF